ncbi:DUF58 domain-containing protein [Cytobacillus depressus]|uniref:DUF58 domain-containing protein n=1 Tax=Cytobacillus depressus TaxID=1602942 RepID=A0A6L3VD44_9BACI|nr:DUF58 domain-containing protein [Cytobacillus depressus]KAB2337480.1 DUF58 domain-containing protein [Cytobacillus depressus]
MNNQQALLSKLQKKRLNVKTRKRGFHKGSRQSNRFGSSQEFSDFRLYQPGDDVRQIDWNVYGRTQKHYIKRFLDEQELSIAIYLDATSSMKKVNKKWELARTIAAALSYIVLNSEDRLFFSAISSSGVQPIKRKGSVYSRRTFVEIMQLNQPEKAGEFIKNLSKTAERKQQLSIIITDGLEPLNEMETVLKKLAAFKQEVWFIQVLATEEAHPSYSGDVKLVDSETDSIVNVSISPSIITEYEKRLTEHNRQLETICRRFGGQYVFAKESRDVQSVLFHDLSGKGLIN